MIHVNFSYDSDQALFSAFEMTGHADFAEAGSDIVCAAVSVVAIGTVNNLKRLAQVQAQVVVDEEEGGLLKVYINPQDQGNDAVQLLLANLYFTLQDVAEEYGAYIQLSMK